MLVSGALTLTVFTAKRQRHFGLEELALDGPAMAAAESRESDHGTARRWRRCGRLLQGKCSLASEPRLTGPDAGPGADGDCNARRDRSDSHQRRRHRERNGQQWSPAGGEVAGPKHSLPIPQGGGAGAEGPPARRDERRQEKAARKRKSKPAGSDATSITMRSTPRCKTRGVRQASPRPARSRRA